MTEEERIKEASARSSRAKKRADQLGEQINQIMDRLAEKGMQVDRLKWRVKARFRYAHTGVEVAHQEAHKAEQRLKKIGTKGASGLFAARRLNQIVKAAEDVAAKSEAYLQAVQKALDLWVELERQT